VSPGVVAFEGRDSSATWVGKGERNKMAGTPFTGRSRLKEKKKKPLDHFAQEVSENVTAALVKRGLEKGKGGKREFANSWNIPLR